MSVNYLALIEIMDSDGEEDTFNMCIRFECNKLIAIVYESLDEILDTLQDFINEKQLDCSLVSIELDDLLDDEMDPNDIDMYIGSQDWIESEYVTPKYFCEIYSDYPSSSSSEEYESANEDFFDDEFIAEILEICNNDHSEITIIERKVEKRLDEKLEQISEGETQIKKEKEKLEEEKLEKIDVKDKPEQELDVKDKPEQEVEEKDKPEQELDVKDKPEQEVEEKDKPEQELDVKDEQKQDGMNIFLDLDETLIGTMVSENWDGSDIFNPHPRPYLKQFLHFVFKNFETVNIFTAATEEWFNEINTYILSPRLMENETEKYEFSIVKTNKNCTKRFPMVGSRKNIDDYAVMNSGRYISIKRLKPMFSSKIKYSHITKHNTVIIDDTSPKNIIIFKEENYGNGIHIKPYYPPKNDEDESDDTLYNLTIFLKKVLKYYAEYGTIRTMEKRNWETDL